MILTWSADRPARNVHAKSDLGHISMLALTFEV